MSTDPELTAAEPKARPAAEAPEPAPQPRERMPPLESRFLYIDVAARRAKQLRRGARPRLDDFASDPETGARPAAAIKCERIAMQEVDEGRIVYELPDSDPPAEAPAEPPAEPLAAAEASE